MLHWVIDLGQAALGDRLVELDSNLDIWEAAWHLEAAVGAAAAVVVAAHKYYTGSH